MSRERKVPGIAKPVVDGGAALRFAAEGGPAPAPGASDKAPGPAQGRVRVVLDLHRDLYDCLCSEAERKGRTPAEAVEKLIKKHLRRS